MLQPSLYELLLGTFSSGLAISQVSEQEQLMLSVMDNIQQILNARAGSLAHLPDYGVPDLSQVIHGLPSTAHQLIHILENTLLRYEPRIKSLDLHLLASDEFGQLAYSLEVELHQIGLVRYGTTFFPEGTIMLRHLKQQQWLPTKPIWR